MTESELVKALARSLLLKEGGEKAESFSSLICIRNYLSAMSKEELLGIATQNGITDHYSF